jgi:hypothetical protein
MAKIKLKKKESNATSNPSSEIKIKSKPASDTLFVSSPKDKRLKSYQDSLGLYNKTKDIQNPKYYKDGSPSWYTWKGNRESVDRFMKKNNIDMNYEYYRTNKFPGKIQPVKTGDFGEGMAYPIYKKPVQPVKYKKSEPKQPEPKKEEPAKKNEIKPVEKKQNVYEGTPVYSPGAGSGMPSALVGFMSKSGDTTYIKSEDYERFAVPEYGKRFIQSKINK